MNRRLIVGAGLLVAIIAVILFVWSRKEEPNEAKLAAADAGAGAGADKPAAAVKPGALPREERGELATDIRVSVDDDPTGALIIEGQVVDSEERPVAGATVIINSNPRRHVRSEADGSFTIRSLVGRNYTLAARKDDAHAGPVTVRLTDKTEPVILRLAPAAAVEVTVLAQETRKPVAGARVGVSGQPELEAITDAAGKVTLKGLGGGWHVLDVDAAGFAVAHHLFDTTGSAGTVEKETVELKHGAKVSGVVLDPDGKPVAEARVMPASTSEWFSLADERDAAAVTDKAGKWTLAAVPAGTFRFRATHDRWAPGGSGAITLDGKTEKSGVEIKLALAAIVVGKVVDKSGTPVAGAAVRVMAKDASGWDEVTRQVFSDDQGGFELPGLARRPVDVVAIHENASSDTASLDLAAQPEQRDVVLTLDVDGTIAGIVVSASGEPVPEVQVTAIPEMSGGARGDAWRTVRLRGFPADVADAGGRFELRGLPDGKYRLRASRGEQQQAAFWRRAGAEAKTGDKNVKLVLEEDGRVTGKVLYADGSAPPVYTVATGWERGQSFSAADGTFQARAAGGKTTLSVTGPSFVQKTVADVTVTSGGETDVGTITVEKGRSISGRVIGTTGQPVAGATVVAGPQLFGSGSELGAGRFGGPNVKSTTSDEEGGYLLAGVGARNLILAADHPTEGRSAMVRLPVADTSVTVDLHLQALGSLEGKITAGGQPVAKAVVMATPQQAARGNFIVQAGEDGAYHYDKLAPDTYLVSGMAQAGMGGGDMVTKTVVVKSGETAHQDIEIPTAGVTVTLKATGAPGVTITTAQLFLMSGSITAPASAEALFEAYAERGAGTFAQGFVIKGAPVVLEKVQPGAYTACGIPIPGDFEDMAQMIKVRDNIDKLIVVCFPKTVTPTPAAQEIVVALPAPPPF